MVTSVSGNNLVPLPPARISPLSAIPTSRQIDARLLDLDRRPEEQPPERVVDQGKLHPAQLHAAPDQDQDQQEEEQPSHRAKGKRRGQAANGPIGLIQLGVEDAGPGSNIGPAAIRDSFRMILLYIDPGAGSLLLQAILAGLLAIPFFFRRTIGNAVRRIKGGRTTAEPVASEDREAPDR